MSTRQRHVFMPVSASTWNQSHRESQLPGLWISVECTEQTPKALCLTTSSLRSFTSPLQNHAHLGHPSLLRCLWGCTLRKEASAGDPSPMDLDTWWLYPGPRGQIVVSSLIGLPGKIGASLKGVSIQGTLPGCFYPSPVQPWDSNLLWFQGSDSIPGQRGQR